MFKVWPLIIYLMHKIQYPKFSDLSPTSHAPSLYPVSLRGELTYIFIFSQRAMLLLGRVGRYWTWMQIVLICVPIPPTVVIVILNKTFDFHDPHFLSGKMEVIKLPYLINTHIVRI